MSDQYAVALHQVRLVIPNVNGLHMAISQAPLYVAAVLPMSALQKITEVWKQNHSKLSDVLVKGVTGPAMQYLLSISPYLPQTQLSTEKAEWGLQWPDMTWMQVRVALAFCAIVP